MTSIRQLLNNHVVNVRFEKRDGTVREMRCTTNPLLIPDNKEPKNVHLTVNSDQVRVFDLEKNEWRSFNVNNLLDYEKE